jgi:hypothetical protein
MVSIAVTNSQGATVVITNANNDVVANTDLLEHTLTATATGGNEGQNCTATAQVTILNLKFSVC